MRIIGIDAGTTKTGYIYLEDRQPIDYGWVFNEDIFKIISKYKGKRPDKAHVVMEDIQSYGMPVGVDVFTTVKALGAFEYYATQIEKLKLTYVKRSEAKLFLCNSARATDANIRQALIDLYGGDEKAVGGKKCKTCKGKGYNGRDRASCDLCGGLGLQSPKGALYGITGHVWSALAVGVTFFEQQQVKVAIKLIKASKG